MHARSREKLLPAKALLQTGAMAQAAVLTTDVSKHSRPWPSAHAWAWATSTTRLPARSVLFPTSTPTRKRQSEHHIITMAVWEDSWRGKNSKQPTSEGCEMSSERGRLTPGGEHQQTLRWAPGAEAEGAACPSTCSFCSTPFLDLEGTCLSCLLKAPSAVKARTKPM